ncbi:MULTISPECIES: hypothetical protein [unclassified Oscillibacter]|uniref:hypothetical protein n=1 Tax=unclassified Oscillibacter TaxID=2629304 RepID=UPI0025F66E42|nr:MULTISPECIES: hypothetical protein [unclassified Oscillibacter]
MRNNAGFWFGMGAGMAAGALVGMMMPHGKRTMKTQVGKCIQKLGVAVDHTVDHLVSTMR